MRGALGLPRGVVDDDLAIRRETRGQDGSAAKGEPVKDRTRRGRQPRAQKRASGRACQHSAGRQEPAARRRRGLDDGSRARLGGFQREGEVGGRLETTVRIFLQAAGDDAPQQRRYVAGKFGGVLLQDRVQRLDSGIALESTRAGEHLI